MQGARLEPLIPSPLQTHSCWRPQFHTNFGQHLQDVPDPLPSHSCRMSDVLPKGTGVEILPFSCTQQQQPWLEPIVAVFPELGGQVPGAPAHPSSPQLEGGSSHEPQFPSESQFPLASHTSGSHSSSHWDAPGTPSCTPAPHPWTGSPRVSYSIYKKLNRRDQTQPYYPPPKKCLNPRVQRYL